MSNMGPLSVSAIRMLVVLSRTPWMFSQDRGVHIDGSQELIWWVGVGYFKGISLLNWLV